MTRIANNNIAIAILAGGQAKRMGGGDKTLRKIGNHSLIRHILNRLNTPPHDYAMAINANDTPQGTAKTRFADIKLPTFPDPQNIQPEAGPLSGILAALEFFAIAHTSQETVPKAVFCIAADLPFIPYNLPETFAETFARKHPHIIVAQSFNRNHPTVSLWKITLKDELRKALAQGVRKIENFTENYHPTVIDFTPPHLKNRNSLSGSIQDPFFNINRPQDLTQAEKHYRTQ